MFSTRLQASDYKSTTKEDRKGVEQQRLIDNRRRMK
ncbi:unnamed protein product [Brassica rapa subsp. trilocularis]